MKKLLLQCLRLFLKISNHAALLLPHVKQTDDQRKRVSMSTAKIRKEDSVDSPGYCMYFVFSSCSNTLFKILTSLL